MAVGKKIVSLIANYDSDDSVVVRLRRARIAPLLDLFAAWHESAGEVNLIDMGGTESYWNILPESVLEQYNVKIVLVNLPGEVLGKPLNERFQHVSGDACDLSQFGDDAFHVAHSNSVIEHVGDWARMKAFASELKRVARTYYVQTPNYWFPVEPHCMTPFIHWLPKPTRIWLVMHLQLGNWAKAPTVDKAVATVESARLLNRKMLGSLFPDAQIRIERLALMPKSIVAFKGVP
jgi:hypothetical protein